MCDQGCGYFSNLRRHKNVVHSFKHISEEIPMKQKKNANKVLDKLKASILSIPDVDESTRGMIIKELE